MRCAVVGGGAWGTALADLLARNGNVVLLWAREADVVESINTIHENARFLSGVRLDGSLGADSRLDHVLASAPELVVFATPSHATRALASDARIVLRPGTIVVVASKGIEEGTLALMSDVVAEALDAPRVVALSGPSFAEEVAHRQPTAVVAASADRAAACAAQQAFSCAEFRVYTHDDLIGVELGGSLKNVMAIATGIAEGLELGMNSRAALITRGLAEMTRLGAAIGARPTTFAGLAGLGDLVLTCTSSQSRNHALGAAIGRGATLSDALAGKETVAEGVHTTRSARALAAREGVKMPIVETVYRTLFDGQSPRIALAELLARDLRSEED
jgi:glycerol-3-phosphate dehydrogenase (NAD(P)+)